MARKVNRIATMRKSSQQGFTLIELMITVAVAAILAAIALPSYQTHVRRGHRAAVQSYLMDAASRQQQRFVDVRSYADEATLNFPLPAELAARYSIAVTPVAGPPASFTITATPQGAQIGDTCGAISINNNNNKTAAIEGCW